MSEQELVVSGNGKYAICLTEGHAQFGWLFHQPPSGQWVTLRKALDSEMVEAYKQRVRQDGSLCAERLTPEQEPQG